MHDKIMKPSEGYGVDQHWETRGNQIQRPVIGSSKKVKIDLKHQPAIRSRYFILDSFSPLGAGGWYSHIWNMVWNLETLE